MKIAAFLGVLLLWAIATTCPAQAHEVRPAYLGITQTARDSYTILWKRPIVGEMALRLVPHLSNGWLQGPPAKVYSEPGHLTSEWVVKGAGSTRLSGTVVAIEGLDESITDVMVRAELLDGRESNNILLPDKPSASIHFEVARKLSVPSYLMLGVDHILTGWDHLGFVLGLLLLVGLRWPLLKAITAFTVAHSITLAASALGVVQLPSAPVEALVALSILFLAVELVRYQKGGTGFAQRHTWLVAFAFGLLHGFAFAGQLRETGLPVAHIAEALFLFNLGVEAGQLLFIAGAALAMLLLRRAIALIPSAPADLLRTVPSNLLGVLSAYWLIERTLTAV
jgi:hydrogenase/urease accessory protein HupE